MAITRKHYIKAAELVRGRRETAELFDGNAKRRLKREALAVELAFVEFFQSEPNFNQDRFQSACIFETK
jgi:hypothetical protein